MKIALDCMGGDVSPVAGNIEGAVSAVEDGGFEIILVGNRDAVEREISRSGAGRFGFAVENAEDRIGMAESPVSVLRAKKNSSIAVAVKLVKEGRADAIVSAGNTGALMTAAKVHLGMLAGVERPAIAVPLPNPGGSTILLDAGANVDSKPGNLYQFALMGTVYSQGYCGKKNPRVGLLSIGEEKSKGNEVTRETYRLLRASNINFAGNIEGKDIFTGEVDVVVCDGFVGNIVLKSTESLAEMLEKMLREKLSNSLRGIIAGFLMKPIYRDFRKKLSRAEYGGAFLMGVNGISVVSHGSASPKAIKNALLCARDLVMHDANEHLKEILKKEAGAF